MLTGVMRMAAGLRRRLMLTYRVRRRLVDLAVSSQGRHPSLRRLVPTGVSRLADAGVDREVTRHRTQFVVARQQDVVRMWHLAAQTADRVAAALTHSGVEFFAMHRPFTRTARWAVRRDELADLAHALANTLGPEAFYYQFDRASPTRLVREGLRQEELTSIEHFRIFQYVRCQITGTLYAASCSCDIAIWDEAVERDTLVAPDRDSVVQEVDNNPLHLETRTRWDGRPEPILAGTGGDAASIEFPVDAVYLWVDDSDPRWRERRARVLSETGQNGADSADETVSAHRFRDRGELRASLRSLEMYAPWIRRIYLVTDDQRPGWLAADNGRVKVVDHREIFSDPSVLPSFNSHAIESQIHRIPGLADHYLLMNDDVMFNRPVTPYNFFTPTGALRVTFSRARRPDTSRDQQTPLEQARLNSAELLSRAHGRRASLLFGHVPFPQRKDIAIEVEERYQEEILTTLRSPFRAPTDVVVNSWLHLYTALFTGRGFASPLRYGYFNIGSSEVRARMEEQRYINRFQVICLNDVPPPPGEPDADPAWLSEWLAWNFPIPTPFETRH